MYECNFVGCEKKADYMIGEYFDPYMDSYVCEEHKDEFEFEFREKLQEG